MLALKAIRTIKLSYNILSVCVSVFAFTVSTYINMPFE